MSTKPPGMSRREAYEARMRESQAESRSKMEAMKNSGVQQPSTPQRPTTAAPSASELKRKEYLAEAKARNDASKKEFEDRVRMYFSKGLEIEQNKAAVNASGQGPKMTNKEKNKAALESGLFLSELKSIGLDVQTMASVTNKMAPSSDNRSDDRSSVRRFNESTRSTPPSSTRIDSASSNFESSSSSVAKTLSYGAQPPPSMAYGQRNSGSSAMVETRLTALENSVSTLQRSLNAQDSKLDTLIDLQRQMLKLIESNGNGGGVCGMGSSGMSNGSMSGGLTGEGLGVSSSSIGAQAVEKPPEFQGRRRRR